MTLSIELNPAAERALREEAQRRGIPPSDLARQILERNLPAAAAAGTGPAPGSPAAQPGSLAALFARWEEEDRTDDPEEIARREKEWEEFARAMNESRRAAGARLLYPDVP